MDWKPARIAASPSLVTCFQREGARGNEDIPNRTDLDRPDEAEAPDQHPGGDGGAGGDGTNPEQLFAAGYSACFIGALKAAGQQLKVKVPRHYFAI